MQKQITLRQQAIKAAKNANWQLAIEFNNSILQQNENDLEALNRLGTAFLQLKDSKKAKKAFLQVIKVDKTNIIAKKLLDKIKNNQKTNVNNFANSKFIENPGKSKNVELHRLAGKKILESLCIGQDCQLKLKNRFVSIESMDKKYIGALPEDLSFRLAKLMKSGNEYSCNISTHTEKKCAVHLKEIKTSNQNTHINSFPTVNTVHSIPETANEKQFLIEEKIPVQSTNNKGVKASDIEETLTRISKTGQ